MVSDRLGSKGVHMTPRCSKLNRQRTFAREARPARNKEDTYRVAKINIDRCYRVTMSKNDAE